MKNLLRFSNKNIAREMIDKRFKECCYFGLLKIVITLNWKEITKSNSVVLSKSKCFSVRQFLMQTDNSYRKIPPIKLHVYFTISILKTYYFKWRFGRIRNTIIKKMESFLTLYSWRSIMSSYRPQPLSPSAHAVNKLI